MERKPLVQTGGASGLRATRRVSIESWGQKGHCLGVQTQSRDTSLEVERRLVRMVRQTPVWRRLQLADRLSHSLRDLVWCNLRQRHPRATPGELRRRFAAIHLGPELARRVLDGGGGVDKS